MTPQGEPDLLGDERVRAHPYIPGVGDVCACGEQRLTGIHTAPAECGDLAPHCYIPQPDRTCYCGHARFTLVHIPEDSMTVRCEVHQTALSADGSCMWCIQ